MRAFPTGFTNLTSNSAFLPETDTAYAATVTGPSSLKNRRTPISIIRRIRIHSYNHTLLDRLETHMHYCSQADLISSFSKYTMLINVISTYPSMTHSKFLIQTTSCCYMNSSHKPWICRNKELPSIGKQKNSMEPTQK